MLHIIIFEEEEKIFQMDYLQIISHTVFYSIQFNNKKKYNVPIILFWIFYIYFVFFQSQYPKKKSWLLEPKLEFGSKQFTSCGVISSFDDKWCTKKTTTTKTRRIGHYYYCCRCLFLFFLVACLFVCLFIWFTWIGKQ